VPPKVQNHSRYVWSASDKIPSNSSQAVMAYSRQNPFFDNVQFRDVVHAFGLVYGGTLQYVETSTMSQVITAHKSWPWSLSP